MLFGLSVEISTPASFLVAAALNYILCIALLFRHKVKWNTAGELVAYLVTIVLMGAVDYGLTIGLVTLGLAQR
jgi:dolichol-phosphate mannosyltransferase